MSDFKDKVEMESHIAKLTGVQGNIPIYAYLSSEVSVRLSTTYGNLVNVEANNLLTTLSSVLTPLRESGFSGQFIQQGFQVWQTTDPIELQLGLEFRFKTDGYTDVIQPVNALLKKVVPSIATKGILAGSGLIPPGPSISQILGLNDKDNSLLSGGESTITVEIGKLIFNQLVLTSATPTYSLNTDTNGNPIYCKVDGTFRGIFVATKGEIGAIHRNFTKGVQ